MLEWYWIFAFTVAAICLVGGITVGVLWRRKENKALFLALQTHMRQELLAHSQNASARSSVINVVGLLPVEELSERSQSRRPSIASSCQSLPSISSKEGLVLANNNEVMMSAVLEFEPSNESSVRGLSCAVGTDRFTPESDYASSEAAAMPTMDLRTSESSLPQTGETDFENNNANTGKDIAKRGVWKLGRTTAPATDGSTVRYEKMERKDEYDGSTPTVIGSEEAQGSEIEAEDPTPVPVESSSSSSSEKKELYSLSTKL